jgi:Bacterial PH domain
MPESLTRWRVASTPTLLKFAGALLLAAVAVLSGDERERLLLAGVGALALGVYGLRDIVAPVRLSADAEGVTVVSGFARRRGVPWREIERVGLGEHRSLGLRTEILEIDAGESLHLFSRYDLGAPCAEVAATLEEMRDAALASAEEEHPEPEAEEEQRRREHEHALDPAATEQRADGVDHEGDRGGR